MPSGLRKRATAVIIENGKILLIHRIKPNEDYFIFPGGGVEEGETIEDALKREVTEEITLEVKKFKLLFSLQNIKVPHMITIHTGNRDEFFFKIEEYVGTPEIGGPEKERMNDKNQYHLVWIDLNKLKEKENVYPKEGVQKLLEVLSLNNK